MIPSACARPKYDAAFDLLPREIRIDQAAAIHHCRYPVDANASFAGTRAGDNGYMAAAHRCGTPTPCCFRRHRRPSLPYVATPVRHRASRVLLTSICIRYDNGSTPALCASSSMKHSTKKAIMAVGHAAPRTGRHRKFDRENDLQSDLGSHKAESHPRHGKNIMFSRYAKFSAHR